MKQRELKFRYWNNEEGKMYFQPKNGWDSFPQKLGMEDMYLQFTGLRDLQDTEIYEGDILKYGEKIIEVKWLVKWLDINYGWLDINYGWNLNPLLNYEIIGNIFENNELLENYNKANG